MPLTRPSVQASVILVSLATPLLIFLSFFEKREIDAARERIQADAESAASKLEMFLSDRLRTLWLMSQYLESFSLTEQNFAKAAGDFYIALPGLKAINWINSEGTILWVYPESGNEAARGMSVLDHPQAAPSFKVARGTGTTTVTPPLELFQGRWGVASYFPVGFVGKASSSPDIDGYLNGVFELESIIREALEPELLVHYEVFLTDGNDLIYPSIEGQTADIPFTALEGVQTEIQGSVICSVHDRQWRLTLQPSKSSWMNFQESAFTLARLVGLCLIAAIAWVVFLVRAKRATMATARLEREQMQSSLFQAQKLEAVGRLAGSVAHDFNNLLTTIVGNTSLLESTAQLSTLEVDRLQQIQVACDRATGLTAQLLAFSSQGSTHAEECEIGSEFLLLLPLLYALVPGDIEIKFHQDCPPTWIRWAPTQLAQVMTNLISNASDAYEATGTIQIDLKHLAESSQLQIAVNDQGSGMPTEVLARAREPFFTTKPAGRGTGLGLASVARIVHEAGGELDLESSPGNGTSVIIRLPVLQSRRAPAHLTHSIENPGPKNKVLMVEDNSTVREVTQSMLKDLGHQVVATNSGHEAVQKFQADSRWDLLFTDLKMPNMHGMELIRTLREQGLQAPAVLCSGYAENLDADELRALKITFLAKPFTTATLSRAISSAHEMGASD
jgi:signal transduction histidine kinase/CheY-like chemotaxis protein